jgi:hypothetical protein
MTSDRLKGILNTTDYYTVSHNETYAKGPHSVTITTFELLPTDRHILISIGRSLLKGFVNVTR